MEGKGRAPTGGTVASEREGGSGERAAAQARVRERCALRWASALCWASAVCWAEAHWAAGLGLGASGCASWAEVGSGPREEKEGRGPDLCHWAGLGLVGVLCFLFLFYFLFFCKLTQTSLNSNKFEFKLPSTQPK